MLYREQKIYNKILKISFLIALISTVNAQLIFAQIFDAAQNPPSLKWRQISTENFQVLYPSGFENEAQRMANTLSSIISRVSFSYKIKPRKITVILQNQGTSSNGFVQLAPRRVEFFSTPPQDFDYQDWLNSLAVHELRHVVQFDKLTGYLRQPVFEELALAIFGITLPPWFYEGDAVTIETALSPAGRGRLPEWDVTLRTNTLSHSTFSYSKDIMGSVKNITPGYYQMGFYMTSKLRRDYGSGIMDSLLTRISHNPVRPYNLSNSLKKFTGLSTRKLHDSTVAELRTKWSKQLADAGAKDYPLLPHQNNKGPADYLYPAAISPTEILALKTGKTSVPKIVRIDSSGNEKTVLKIGLQEDPSFNYAAGKITWDEFRYDKRYQKRSFNVINVYELSTGNYRQLTHKTRLFAPALSPDGTKIIAVQISYTNQISLLELDATNGKTIREFASPDNIMLQKPRYNPRADKIIVTGVSQQGTTLLELNITTGQFTRLLPYQPQLIANPVYTSENQVVFKAHFNGIDNLYRLNTQTRQTEQITSVKFGAYNPSYDESSHRMLFNNYQFNGNEITSLTMPRTAIPIQQVKNTSIHYIAPITRQEGNSSVFDSISNRHYASKPYRELEHLFYFHSVYPVIEENEFYDDYNYGLQLQSDNKLNTMSFYAGYRFNNALRKSEYFGGITYSRFYPVLSLNYQNQARLYYQKTMTGYQPVSWRENVWEAKAEIPFTFNRLNYTYSTGTRISTSYVSRYNSNMSNLVSHLDFPMLYEVYFSRNSSRSPRQLAPRWGQNLLLSYQDVPFEKNLDGNILVLKSTFYFPGFALNHSFRASFNYQDAAGDFIGTVDIPKVSGYSNLSMPTVNLKNTLLTAYSFPLFYPDWELGPLAYIKRFKGSLFADFENIGYGNAFAPKTYGLQLSADMNLLRFYLPNFDVGGKLIFVNDKSHQNPILEANVTYSF
ncbi:hypothetical protein FW774_14340 [Pedobacter sp. BS3]|uniref:TolB family protein n=1 Tax=Pedobacter sp. BS3 TaxID=2567937 RepID=UPI0011EC276A|nr:hypothetical protein [Pedobacter sp. BS3]TZF82676.1 hypothetical protein FW774_14340 [Pedobacter sp. BS3]